MVSVKLQVIFRRVFHPYDEVSPSSGNNQYTFCFVIQSPLRGGAFCLRVILYRIENEMEIADF